ncbi:MAG: ABC transporter ATP-binding protein [Clostridiales bacterium]|jgi:oligopeptide transport system ATP-binding protein|nr:ABC transporter ATP-binding protein [Clostridiales bacterium]
MGNLLELQNVSISFSSGSQRVTVVEDVSFTLESGLSLGIAGESGSGKSVTSLAIMRLLPRDVSAVQGKILFQGKDLLTYPEREMRHVRGNEIAMIFQEPMTSLNPIIPCGKQIMEPLLLHTSMNRKQAAQKTLALLEQCGIPAPEARFHDFPHQMSGGMRQRIMIAIALACDPRLLIADEPTTALDVTIQAQILDLLKNVKRQSSMGAIMITHDLGIVRDFCDSVIIMYCGQIVESAPVEDLFTHPAHPYTRGLLSAIPKLSGVPGGRLEAIEGMAPDIGSIPPGCRFHTRCPHAAERCRQESPELRPLPGQGDGQRAGGHLARCFLMGGK